MTQISLTDERIGRANIYISDLDGYNMRSITDDRVEIGRLEVVASLKTMKFASADAGFRISDWTPVGKPVTLKPDYNPQGRDSITGDDVLEGEIPAEVYNCGPGGYLILDKNPKEFSEVKVQFYKLKENAKWDLEVGERK